MNGSEPISNDAEICWSRLLFFALAMTALGRSVQIDNGMWGRSDPSPIGWLAVAVICAFAAVFAPLHRRIGRRAFVWTAASCVLWNLIQIASRYPMDFQRTLAGSEYAPFEIATLLVAVCAALVLYLDGSRRMLAFAAMVGLVGYMGVWVMNESRNPFIDVYVFQRDGAQRLAQGRDPYDMTFPDIYGTHGVSTYGPGIAQHGRLLFGYPYWPETLLAIMPAKLLHLDLRYAHLLALLAAVLLIAAVNPTTAGYLAAMLLLTTPRSFYVFANGYIEPFVLLTLVLTVLLAARSSRWLFIAVGLMLASKQYMPAVVILMLGGSASLTRTIVLLLKAAAVSLIMLLPLALWNMSAFWWSTMVLQTRQPFRSDAISFLSWMGESFWSKQSLVVIPFSALFISMALMIRRRRSIGFAGAVGFSYLMFFAFNKQAFVNYYYLVIGAMALAIAEPAKNELWGQP